MQHTIHVNGRVIILIPQDACMPIVQSIVAHSMLLASLSHDLQVDPNSPWATVTTGKNISFANKFCSVLFTTKCVQAGDAGELDRSTSE